MSSSTTAAPASSRSIVVGVDGSPSSEQALRWAVGQARLTGQHVEAVTSWDYPLDYGVGGELDVDWAANAAEVLRGVVQSTVDDADTARVSQQVIQGHPVQVLLNAARGADLLVVGSRGHGGFAGMLLGSVSQHVVAHAPCPVVVVHEPAHPPTQP